MLSCHRSVCILHHSVAVGEVPCWRFNDPSKCKMRRKFVYRISWLRFAVTAVLLHYPLRNVWDRTSSLKVELFPSRMFCYQFDQQTGKSISVSRRFWRDPFVCKSCKKRCQMLLRFNSRKTHHKPLLRFHPSPLCHRARLLPQKCLLLLQSHNNRLPLLP